MLIAKTVNARGYSSQIAYFILWSPESAGRLGQASVTYFISNKGSGVSTGAVELAVISYVSNYSHKRILSRREKFVAIK